MIKIIGMGIRDDDVTLKGIKAIKEADIVISKTKFSNYYTYFEDNGIKVLTLDDVYEQCEDFDELNRALANKVASYKDNNIVYCVEGNGYDDYSVILLKELLGDIEIISGVSSESGILNLKPDSCYMSIFATDLLSRRAFFIDSKTPLIIKEIDNYYFASEIKLYLLRLIGDVEILLYNDEKISKIKVSELDRQSYNNTTMCYIPQQGCYNKKKYSFSDLLEITFRLRDPDGCKWDRIQTHQSIRGNAIEEAYELVEAIDLDDIDKMCEETGDVLLQGVFHAVIAQSANTYDIVDVLSVLCNKLITRHTHIFGNDKADNIQEALINWERAKAIEKGHNSYSEKMNSVPDNFPALIRAYKIQKTARKSGFDWEDINGAVAKIGEELEELLSAKEGERETEAGDLLFSVVNVLRFMDINPEVALGKTINKFLRRYKYIEEKIKENGKTLGESTLEEMDKYWEESKNEDR